jgi:hypothetical protein
MTEQDPTPPTDDEANDAALPEATEPQGEDVRNDEIPVEEEEPS